MADDDIVVVGVGCKYPGADNLEEFWRVLANGENHVKEIPKERWNVDAFYDPDPNTGGKTNVRNAGFINRYDEWDHRFYGLNDIEAEHVDPQQRVVLDCVHMALEDGGITKKDIDSTQTGVYIGSMSDDYKTHLVGDTTITSPYFVTGIHQSIISARVAYVYNLFGSAITIDTACSSSLVAIDLASQALALGNIDVAICGGVNIVLDPALFATLSNARMLSPTGQCQAFSANANGYARSEGCGIVILKKLKQALRDGNKIWGIIKTGSNQDGHMMSPITAPSGQQQGQLLERMYKLYNVNKEHMQVIEAHGTGTPIGDPIESHALGKFFRGTDNMERTDTLYIGSVKTNIGHTEAAAGVAGLIKVLLMMKNEQIVPSLMYNKSNENPKIQFHKYGIEVVTRSQRWAARNDQGRLACVNSFGFGGTNAHAIVKEFVHLSNLDNVGSHKRVLPYLVAITSPTNESLQINMHNFLSNLKGNSYNMGSLSFTSTCKRDHRRYRKCFAVESQESLIGLCEKYLSSKQKVRSRKTPKLVFVFCGVGTTWNGMCQDMFTFDSFDQAIQEIDQILSPLTGWRIRDKLMEGNELISNPLIAHIAIFSCQVGILAMLKDFGVLPDAVVGQSVGEVAAAYASGSIDIGSAVQIIYQRSTQLSTVLKGGMAVVKGIPWQKVDDFCNASRKVINIAVFNSPTSCTVTGDNDEIVRLKNELLRNNVMDEGVLIDLDVQCAYHSPYVAQAAANLQSNLKRITSGVTSIPIVSTVTGKQAPYNLFSQLSYWKENMQSPVKFEEAIKTVSSVAAEGTIFVEIGPSPVLRSHLKQILNDENKYISVPTMIKQKDSNKSLANTICALFEYGFDPNWKQVVPYNAVATDIPKYAFTKNRSLYIPENVTLSNEGILAVEKVNSHAYCRNTLSETGTKEIEATVNEIKPRLYFNI